MGSRANEKTCQPFHEIAIFSSIQVIQRIDEFSHHSVGGGGGGADGSRGDSAGDRNGERVGVLEGDRGGDPKSPIEMLGDENRRPEVILTVRVATRVPLSPDSIDLWMAFGLPRP